MGVFRRKDRGGDWTYRFEKDNEEYKAKCFNLDGTPARTKAEARLAEARALEAVQKKRKDSLTFQGQAAFRGGFTLAQAYAAHGNKLVTASIRHRAAFRRHAREALEFFGEDIPVTELRDESVQDFLNRALTVKRRIYLGGQRAIEPEDLDNSKLWRELDKVRSESEVNHLMNALRSALKAAHNVRDSITGASALPFPPTVPAVKVPKRKPTPMRAEEFEARYEEAAPWVRDAMDLMRYFGLRVSEALSARISLHVNFKLKCLSFRGEEVKGGDNEFARGGSRGWAILERLIKQARARGTDYLVTYPGIRHAKTMMAGKPLPARGVEWRPVSSIRNAFVASAARAGIAAPRRAHDLRAAYVTELGKSLGPDQWRRAARHKSIETTLRYSDPEERELEEAIERAIASAGQ
jgi:hypothetical protein